MIYNSIYHTYQGLIFALLAPAVAILILRKWIPIVKLSPVMLLFWAGVIHSMVTGYDAYLAGSIHGLIAMSVSGSLTAVLLISRLGVLFTIIKTAPPDTSDDVKDDQKKDETPTQDKPQKGTCVLTLVDSNSPVPAPYTKSGSNGSKLGALLYLSNLYDWDMYIYIGQRTSKSAFGRANVTGRVLYWNERIWRDRSAKSYAEGHVRCDKTCKAIGGGPPNSETDLEYSSAVIINDKDNVTIDVEAQCCVDLSGNGGSIKITVGATSVEITEPPSVNLIKTKKTGRYIWECVKEEASTGVVNP